MVYRSNRARAARRGYRTKRSMRRRTYRRRIARRYSRRIPLEFPQSVMVKLRSVEPIDLSVTAATENAKAIRINGVQDPYYPLGGGTPSGFDQYASMYSRYICYGSSHKAVFHIYTTNTTKTVVGTAVLNSTDSLPASGSYGQWLTECKGSSYKMITARSSDYNVIPKFYTKKYCSVKRIEGLSSLTPNDFNYVAPVTGCPTYSPLLYLVAATTDGSAFTGQITCNMVSTYYVKFYLPKAAENTV